MDTEGVWRGEREREGEVNWYFPSFPSHQHRLLSPFLWGETTGRPPQLLLLGVVKNNCQRAKVSVFLDAKLLLSVKIGGKKETEKVITGKLLKNKMFGNIFFLHISRIFGAKNLDFRP